MSGEAFSEDIETEWDNASVDIQDGFMSGNEFSFIADLNSLRIALNAYQISGIPDRN